MGWDSSSLFGGTLSGRVGRYGVGQWLPIWQGSLWENQWLLIWQGDTNGVRQWLPFWQGSLWGIQWLCIWQSTRY